MPSINLDFEYFTHPKTRRLIGLLGRGSEVLLPKLWIYCGKFHAKDGELTGYSEKEIEGIAEWWGKPGEMIPAIVKVGYAEPLPSGGIRLTGWNDHQGHILAYKERAKAAANFRWGHASRNASSIPDASLEQCPCGTVQGNAVQGGAIPDSPPRKKSEKPVKLFPREIEAKLDAVKQELRLMRESGPGSKFKSSDGKFLPKWDKYFTELLHKRKELEDEMRGVARPA